MLYQVHELQHAALAPVRFWAEAGLKFFNGPGGLLQFNPAARYLAASYELFLRVTHRYDRPAFGLDETLIDGRAVAVREEIALAKPFCNLTRFARSTPKGRSDPKVLLVAPLSGHYATLLRDTVRAMLPEHDVYVTDWVDARAVPLAEGVFGFDNYVRYVQEFIRHLGADVHVISVCQPTVPVLVAASLLAANNDIQPRTLTMMGGPIDTRCNPTSVNYFAKHRSLEWFEHRLICRVPGKYPGSGRRVYPGFMQLAGFVAMNPERHIDSHREFFRQLVRGDGDSAEAHRKFYDEYNAVMDLPAEYYLETVQRVFQEHLLPRGMMVSCDQPVRPQAITQSALFTIEGEHDDISGHGQTEAAHELCTGIAKSRRKHLLAKEVGHYGIFSGRRFREQIYPQIRDFIRKHNAR
jgi:poly(3-hydroxybutyrate) depolymerase